VDQAKRGLRSERAGKRNGKLKNLTVPKKPKERMEKSCFDRGRRKKVDHLNF